MYGTCKICVCVCVCVQQQPEAVKPLHDPSLKGSLVMPRPTPQHQVHVCVSTRGLLTSSYSEFLHMLIM